MNMAYHFHQSMTQHRATALPAFSGRSDSRALLALCLACCLASWSPLHSAPMHSGAVKPVAKPVAAKVSAVKTSAKLVWVKPAGTSKIGIGPKPSSGVQSQVRVIGSNRSRPASGAGSRPDARSAMQAAAQRFMQKLLGAEQTLSFKSVRKPVQRAAPKATTATIVAAKAPSQLKLRSTKKPMAAAKPPTALVIITGRGQMLTSLGLPRPSRIAPAVAPTTLWARNAVAQASLTPPLHPTMPSLALSGATRHVSTRHASTRSRNEKNNVTNITTSAQNLVWLRGLPSGKAPRLSQNKARTQKSGSRLQTTVVAASSARAGGGHLTSIALPRPFSVPARAAFVPVSETLAPASRPVRVIRAGTAPWLDKILQVDTASSAAPLLKYGGVTETVQTWMPTPAKQATRLAAARKPVFAVPSDAKGTPSASWARRKVITVASLKQLPPATQPLPIWMRGAVIAADAVAPKATSALPPSLPRLSASPHSHVRASAQANGLWAQNSGAPPLRQPSRPVTNSDRLPNQLEVSVGTFVVLLTTSDLDTVAVAEPGIADVAVVNTRAVLVNGKAPGVTSLVVVDRFKIRQYQVRVVAAPGSLPRDIAAQIALPGVGVRQVRDAIVLEGEVDSAEEVRRAVEIAGIYATKVINQLTVRGALGTEAALASQIQTTINLPNVTARLVGDTVVLDGTVENSSQFERAQTVATALGKKVLNLIKLPTLTIDQLREGLGITSVAPGSAANNDTAPNGTTPNGAAGTNGTTSNGAALAGMTVRQVGDQIILEGYATSQARIDDAVALAARSGLQVVNRLQVAPPVTEEVTFRNAIERAIGAAGIRGVAVSGNSKLAILHGTVADTSVGLLAEHIARSYSAEIQNLLYTSNPLLVNIDVSVLEITRTSARNLGISFTNPIVFGEAATVGGIVGRQTPIQATLGALIDNNQARLLARPSSTVMSGRTAGFSIGGQVPIPSGSTTGQAGTSTTIVFKDFGIFINVIPTATTNGGITMRVFTEVSQPNFDIGVIPPGGGSVIPGFDRRATASEVSVPPGGAIALGGLIQNNVRKLTSRIPVLSQIPILGKLFTSKRFIRDETELVIFVAPRLLPNPLRPGQTVPVTVIGGTDNAGTPTFGTGGITRDPTATRRGASDRIDFPPVVGGDSGNRSSSGGAGTASP